MKEKEKSFMFDVTLGFEVKAEDKEKAKAIIEEELGYINRSLITVEIWYEIPDKKDSEILLSVKED